MSAPVAQKYNHGILYILLPSQFRLLLDPNNDDGHVIGIGGGGYGTGTGRRLGGQQEVRVQGYWRVEGARGDYENTPLFGGRVLVHIHVMNRR